MISRSRRSLRRPDQGSGEGFIAVRLAELHGGRLEIESAPGKGTTVRVILPAAT